MTLQGTVATRHGATSSQQTRIALRLMATTDLHAHLLPFNYYTDTPDDSIGLARLAALIADARQEAENSLLLDNGDTLQGAPLGDAALKRILPAGRPHPMVAAMSALGYDAATLGNHDFDHGIAFLDRSLASATYPVVLANAKRHDGRPYKPGHVLLTREFRAADGTNHVIRIAVIGITPPQTGKWNRLLVQDNLQFVDCVDAVKAELDFLQSEAPDLTIVLAHSGLGPDRPVQGAENTAAAIAALPGVDAVVAGHTHATFPESQGDNGLIAGTPVVQPGYWGSHLGLIDLSLIPSTASDALHNSAPFGSLTGRRWRVSTARASIRPIALAEKESPARIGRVLRAHAALKRQIAADHRATREYTGQPLGQSTVALETFFSFLAPCAATQLVADAQRAAASTLIADRPDLADLPLLSAVAPFKCGGRGGPINYTDIPPGPLKLRHAADLYVYPNTLSLLRVTGAEILRWLERAASVFHTVVPSGPGGAPQPLIDHAFAGYNFDRMDGLAYDIDLTCPALTSADGETVFDGPGRIRNLARSDGTPVASDDVFLVASNGYRANGGGHFDFVAETVLNGTDPVRDWVARYIAKADGALAPRPSPSFGFTALNGTPVMVETGPGALGHPDRLEDLGLADHGPAPSGFQRFVWVL